MTHAAGIHVHVFDEVDIFNGQGFAAGAAAFRPEGMPADTFEHDFLSVDIESVSRFYLNGSETKSLSKTMYRLAALGKGENSRVEMGCLGCPGLNVRSVECETGAVIIECVNRRLCDQFVLSIIDGERD